jgi:tRNA(Glu) U13 pseudouridine synthase TruD
VRAGDAPDALVLEFTLPPGAYATVLLAEVTKN